MIWALWRHRGHDPSLWRNTPWRLHLGTSVRLDFLPLMLAAADITALSGIGFWQCGHSIKSSILKYLAYGSVHEVSGLSEFSPELMDLGVAVSGGEGFEPLHFHRSEFVLAFNHWLRSSKSSPKIRTFLSGACSRYLSYIFDFAPTRKYPWGRNRFI